MKEKFPRGARVPAIVLVREIDPGVRASGNEARHKEKRRQNVKPTASSMTRKNPSGLPSRSRRAVVAEMRCHSFPQQRIESHPLQKACHEHQEINDLGEGAHRSMDWPPAPD